MTFWIVLWKVVLIVALLAFAAMSVVVTIGGASDLRKLVKRLSEK